MERHPFDLLSLLLGLAVTSLAVVGATDAWRLDPAPWLWPTVLVLTGVVLLLAMATASRQPGPAGGVAPDGSDPDDGLRARARAEVGANDVPDATVSDMLDTTANGASDTTANDTSDTTGNDPLDGGRDR